MKRFVAVSVLAWLVGVWGCSSEGDNGGNDSSGTGSSSSTDVLDWSDTGGTSGLSGDGGSVDLTDEQVEATLSAACAGFSLEPENIPGVLQIVVDISQSMHFEAPGGGGTKWDVTREALLSAIDALPPTLAVGLQTYPNSAAAMDGANPGCVSERGLVPPALLGDPGSQQRAALADHLNAVELVLGTPTHDAYEYALANGLEQYTGGGDRFMLLITDGAPTQLLGCGELHGHEDPVDTDPIVASIAEAKAQGISTFIIGSPGSEGSSGLDMRAWLSEAAIAGGTDSPSCTVAGPDFCHFDMSQATDFSQTLTSGLGAISAQVAKSCSFGLPQAPDGETIDPSLTAVVAEWGDGTNDLLLVDTQGDCSTGWTMNDAGEIVLCGESCAAIEADETSTITVVVGCTQDEVVELR